MAPELLRDLSAMPPNGTQKGDVYAFGIIVQEIILGDQPFAAEHEKMVDQGNKSKKVAF